MNRTARLSFVGLILLISCERQYQDITPREKERLPRFAYSSLDREEKLKSALDGFIRNSNNKSNGARLRSSLDDIDPDSIQKVLQSDSTNYTLTMRLRNGGNLSSFENIVFRRTAHGFLGFFVEYKSTSGLFSPTNFTGTVSKYDLDGNLLQKRFFEKGRATAPTGGRVAEFCSLQSMSKSCMDEIFDGWDHSTGAPIFRCNRYMVYLTFDCPEEYTPSNYSGYGTYIADYYPSGGGGGGSATSITGHYDPLTETTTYQPDDPWAVTPPLPTSEELVQAIRDRAAADVEALLQVDPLALIDLPCSELQKWQNVASYTPPQSVTNKINTLKQNYPSASALFTGNFSIQTLQNASGTAVNLDYFSVRVTQLPEINGQTVTAAQFLNHIRTNINSYIDTQYSEFSPYNEVPTGVDEAALWASSNPLECIIHIEIPFDEGSVICSEYTQNYWRFTTISAPWDKTHPVSGTREFGFEVNQDGSYNFYTRGVDRITQSVNDMLVESETFSGADNLWASFQNGIQNFVSQNGGSATVNSPIKGRPNWQDVRDVLNGSKPVSSLGCQ